MMGSTTLAAVIAAFIAAVSGAVWAYDGNPVAFGVMVFASLFAVAGMVRRHAEATTALHEKDAGARLRHEARTSIKTKAAADRLADTLVTQDQITADTLEKADRDVTRNVRSKDDPQ